MSFYNVEESQQAIYQDKAGELGIRVCCHRIDYAQLTKLADAHNALTPAARRVVVSVSWYLQIAKRIAQAALISNCKSNKGDELFERVRQYGFDLNASFFAQTALQRAEAIYSAYFSSPKLCGEMLARLVTENRANDRILWNELNDTHKHLGIQYQMLLESSARIAIIKHALDDSVERRGEPLPTLTLKIGTAEFPYQKYDLPNKFVEGLKQLHDHPHSLRLPYLFQVFAEVFGGYIVQDSADELEAMELITGIPAGEVLGCLRLLDMFFAPGDGSMFYTQFKGRLLLLKMTPGFVRGVGSLLRMQLFNLKNYDAKYKEMGWLLSKWHNAAYYVLEPTLAIKTVAGANSS